MVHVLAVVGVPWQDLAVDAAASDLHYVPPEKLDSVAWNQILGDPSAGGSAPSDPHMMEAIDPRPGLADPGAGYMADPIHGHERNIPNRDDLQYTCIFERPVVEPCADYYTCDCFGSAPGDDNPICETPDGSYEHVQHFGRAYPGLRTSGPISTA